MSHMEEATELLRQAGDVNDQEAHARLMERVAAHTRLAAIERGLPPAFGVPEENEPPPEPRPRLRASEPQEGA